MTKNLECKHINTTEIVQMCDAKTSKFNSVIRKEIEEHKKRNISVIVNRSDIPTNSDKLGGRFVLSMKNDSTKIAIWKAGLVFRGHRDVLKSALAFETSLA